MATRRQISIRKLKEAFSLAEEMLRGESNHFVTRGITNERGSVSYEGLLNQLYVSALSSVFPNYVVEREHSDIDICVLDDKQVVTAIECKGMVSNARSRDLPITMPLEVHGIRTRKLGSVGEDIDGLGEKLLKTEKVIPHYEVFVPVVYEIYRRRATQSDLHAEKKPWTTHPQFRKVRGNLKEDFSNWFERRQSGGFTLIHATRPIELKDANRFWLERFEGKKPWTPINKAYASFFAFGRYVEV